MIDKNIAYLIHLTTAEYERLEALKACTEDGSQQTAWIAGLHAIFGIATVDQWLLLSQTGVLRAVVVDAPYIPCPERRLWRFHNADGNPLMGGADTLFVPKFSLRPLEFNEDEL